MKEQLFIKRGIKWINTYYDCSDYIILNCSKEETNESYDIMIDKEDFDLVKQGQWFVVNKRRNSQLKDIFEVTWSKQVGSKQRDYMLHQWLLGTKGKNVIVDHINNDRFDNRRQNLRIVDNVINAINQQPRMVSKNKFIKNRKGFTYEKRTGKYLVRINIKGKEVNIGRYDTDEEAELIFLKANIILGNNKVSFYIQKRIKELGVTLTEKEINEHKYLHKVFCLNDNKIIGL